MSEIPFKNHGIILFDGVCNYCSRWVDLIMKDDKKDYFRFATLQSETAKKLLNKENIFFQRLPPTESGQADSVIFIEEGKIFFRSDAGLRILRKLKFPFPLLYCLIIFPKFIHDGVYDLIANSRYKWFGKKKKFAGFPLLKKRKENFSIKKISFDK